MLVEENLYWLALGFKAVSTNIDLVGSEQPLENFSLIRQTPPNYKTTELGFFLPLSHSQVWETKTWVDWMFNSCNFPSIKKTLLHHAFHSSLQEYCGQDVVYSINFRKYWYTDQKPKGGKLVVIPQSCLHNTRGTNRSVCEMEAMQCLMTVPPCS